MYKHDAKLSTECWNLRTTQLNPRVSWKIKGIYKSYNSTSKRCNLYLTEKREILDKPAKNLLNKRSEIISKCRHNNKYRLKILASSMTLLTQVTLLKKMSCNDCNIVTTLQRQLMESNYQAENCKVIYTKLSVLEC